MESENIKAVLSILGGEKATRLMQEQNKISFIVSAKSNKITIKNEIEKQFDVKVQSVNIINKMDGSKVAIVKLAPEYLAMDLATKLGLI